MQGLYWTYAFNVIVNSAFSFFTAVVLVQIVMLFLRVKHPRVRVICSFLPFCKICLDLFLYHFSNWALLHGVNPILAEAGTRQISITMLSFTGIQFSMQDGMTFSLADLIALSIDPLWIQAIVSIAVLGAVISCGFYLIRILRDRRRIEEILQSATPIDGLSVNSSLTELMKRKQVHCCTTALVDVPCIARKTMLFPARLINDLSQEECEAIIAHELAHLQWRDCGLRLLYSVIGAVFWWIPTKWWQRHIEEMQEQASDLMIHRFGISRFALAGAILKTAQRARATPPRLVVSFLGRTQPLRTRMRMILREPMRQALGWKAIQYGLLAFGLLSILFGKLWIF